MSVVDVIVPSRCCSAGAGVQIVGRDCRFVGADMCAIKTCQSAYVYCM